MNLIKTTLRTDLYYTLYNYTLEDYTLEDYTLEDYTLEVYTLEDYTLEDLTRLAFKMTQRIILNTAKRVVSVLKMRTF